MSSASIRLRILEIGEVPTLSGRRVVIHRCKADPRLKRWAPVAGCGATAEARDNGGRFRLCAGYLPCSDSRRMAISSTSST